MTHVISTHNSLASRAIHMAFKGTGKCINTEYLNGKNTEMLVSSLRKLPSMVTNVLLLAQLLGLLFFCGHSVPYTCEVPVRRRFVLISA